MELVILAAGMGSRFGGLKQIEPIDEYKNFIIDYSIYDAIKNGFNKVIFIIKEENFELFKNTIGHRIESKIKVEYVFQKNEDIPVEINLKSERQKPWGTAHAIYAARNKITGNFMIINADDFYGCNAYYVASQYMQSLTDKDCGKYANVAFKVKNTLTENGSVKRGVCITNKDNALEKIIESSIINQKDKILATPLDKRIEPFQLNENQLVSMNMFIFTKDILQYLEKKFIEFLNDENVDLLNDEFLIPTVVTELMKEKKATVKILETNSIWHGVTYREDKNNVVTSLKELVDKNEYKKGLWD